MQYSNDAGTVQFATAWRDPEFDPNTHAFYYIRVLEIPTPRWTTYDAARYGQRDPGAHVHLARVVHTGLQVQTDRRTYGYFLQVQIDWLFKHVPDHVSNLLRVAQNTLRIRALRVEANRGRSRRKASQ